MQEIRCPHCGENFEIDESGYAAIAQQIRDAEFEKELERRRSDLERQKASEMELLRLAQEKVRGELLAQKNGELAERDREIEKLKAALVGGETEKKLAVAEALREQEKVLAEKEAQLVSLNDKLAGKETEIALREKSLKEEYAARLHDKDEQIEYYKDFKTRQSTKMIGESLEQHCLTQFNAIRMTAFRDAYFEKDNDASSGSKGDFIFRENAPDGTELISIMFEMKNEMDGTEKKHKNEDFFKELDKDRREKKCEYAVLVSMLESDSDLYNGGIVDVSYRYEKMYVIRPQCFIPMITLLRNAALGSLAYKQALQAERSRQIDVANFEENMQSFKEGFARNYRLASESFGKAIEEIDKSIQHMQKIRDALLSSENQLRLANDKAEDLSIKKLTKNAPSVREMIESAKNDK